MPSGSAQSVWIPGARRGFSCHLGGVVGADFVQSFGAWAVSPAVRVPRMRAAKRSGVCRARNSSAQPHHRLLLDVIAILADVEQALPRAARRFAQRGVLQSFAVRKTPCLNVLEREPASTRQRKTSVAPSTSVTDRPRGFRDSSSRRSPAGTFQVNRSRSLELLPFLKARRQTAPFPQEQISLGMYSFHRKAFSCTYRT